ncbi:MAG TPA: serine/threonine-protein kinase [Aggregatilineaceae bacterium]|nr:serine/threonine-protein kinase [Aggregatilineaceae bacterium]
MTFTIGDTLGPYRIIEQIGQGGMATVYKAYHANLDRYVAVKVLHPAFKEDPSFFERFKREAQIVAKLEHPAIIPVYDYADKDGQPYLVMKFIEGETLKARLKRKSLTLTETITIFESVAAGLTYAHTHGILHRDIKPSNIMLDKDGTPYIADFGLARIAQAGESTLSQDMMLGTPQYISPEQAQGVRDLGPSTDVYSLGIVLYEIIVGRVPFSADTPFAIIHDHIYKPLPIPTQLNPDVPPQIEKVLLKALSKMPQDRFQSAVELVSAFRQAVEETGLTELGAARYRAVVHSEAPTSATVPPVTPSPTPTPAYVGVPSVMTQSITDSAARRAARRRRRNLWILGGIGSLLLICLTSLFILVRALSDPDLRPWDTSNVEARDPDENAVPPDGEQPLAPPHEGSAGGYANGLCQ